MKLRTKKLTLWDEYSSKSTLLRGDFGPSQGEYMNNTTKEALNQQVQLQNQAREIAKLPLSARLREIKKLLFKIHPAFAYPDSQHCEAVTDIRHSLPFNDFKASEQKSMRHLFKIPEYIWHALKADPEFYKLQNSSEKDDARKLHKALWDAFPEYRVARRF